MHSREHSITCLSRSISEADIGRIARLWGIMLFHVGHGGVSVLEKRSIPWVALRPIGSLQIYSVLLSAL
jgi:hypothetical protein